MPPRRAGTARTPPTPRRAAARTRDAVALFPRRRRAELRARPPPRLRRRGSGSRVAGVGPVRCGGDQLQQVGLVVQRAPERGLARELARANLVRGGETRRDGGERGGGGRAGTGSRRRKRSRREPPPRERRRRRRPRGVETQSGALARYLGQTRALRGDRQSLTLGQGVLAAPLRVGVALVAPLRGGRRRRRARAGRRRARGGEEKRRRRGARAGRRAGGTRARCVSAASRSRRRGCAT